MRLKKLEVCGFKSFVDRSVMMFDHQVTGVVGPNGCGKSNIVDAIRWVMGEQSAKNLRGKSMDDVIFNGSEARGPMDFAEVSITFDNEDGLTPPEYRDYAEITVTRKVDRSGGSEYQINHTPVRLMDVTNLFLGTGVGKRAYSIIEQGRIGYIVSSKPQDRRHLIEEAAGVTKFKSRKKAAERKMDQTRQNLLRVSDIIGEIEKSLASLQRQSQKAERYKRYRGELRDHELHIASHRWLDLTTQHNRCTQALTEVAQALTDQRHGLQTAEAHLEHDRAATRTKETGVETAQQQAFELDAEVTRLENEVTLLSEQLSQIERNEARLEQEKADLARQKEQLTVERDQLSRLVAASEGESTDLIAQLEQAQSRHGERRTAADQCSQEVSGWQRQVSEGQSQRARTEALVEGFAEKRRDQSAQIEQLERQQEQARAQVQELQGKQSAAEVRLHALTEGKVTSAEQVEEMDIQLRETRGQVPAAEAEVERLREQVATARSRLRSLEEVAERREGSGEGVRHLLAQGSEGAAPGGDSPTDGAPGDGASQLQGTVSDLVDCDPEWTSALAAALGPALECVVAVNDQGMAHAVQALRENGWGRASLIQRSTGHASHDGDLNQESGVLGPLVDKVRCSEQDRPWVHALLQHTWLVDDLETARRLAGERGSHALAANFVTPAGESVDTRGIVTVGQATDGGSHHLQIKHEIRELHTQVAQLDGELTTAVEHLNAIKTRTAELQATLESARGEAHQNELSVVKTEGEMRKFEQEIHSTEQQIARAAEQVEQVRARMRTEDQEHESAQGTLQRLTAELEESTVKLGELQAVLAERTAAAETQAKEVSDLRVRSAKVSERLQAEQGTHSRLSASIQELTHRHERNEQAIAEGKQAFGQHTERRDALQEQQQTAVSAAVQAKDVLEALRAEYDALRVALTEKEAGLKQQRQELEQTQKDEQTLTLQERELNLELNHLLEHVEERYRTDLRHELIDHHNRPSPDGEIQSRVKELNRLIERMGEINLTAVQEYEEKKGRYDYLKSQETDLEEALSQLESAIRKMNRESRRLFKEAFEAVNERFKKTFPAMFGGGKAELKLTDPNDLLESGIEIVAQPPGKRLGSLELMSGGEKALTAVSLVFAIFQYKPSPFCLLDEVDAPLDEANVGRFADAVQQMTERSQFILITHSKRTMEAADVLYGVTMDTPGISKLVSVELQGKDKEQRDGEPRESPRQSSTGDRRAPKETIEPPPMPLDEQDDFAAAVA